MSVVTDGVTRFKLPPDTSSPMHPADEVNKALEANFVDTELFNNTYTPIVVNTGKKLVVIDTGLGEAGIDDQQGHRRQFPSTISRPPASTRRTSTP